MMNRSMKPPARDDPGAVSGIRSGDGWIAIGRLGTKAIG
jgi:hypothetical protein